MSSSGTRRFLSRSLSSRLYRDEKRTERINYDKRISQVRFSREVTRRGFKIQYMMIDGELIRFFEGLGFKNNHKEEFENILKGTLNKHSRAWEMLGRLDGDK